MRLEDARTEQRSRQNERSVLLSWVGGEDRLWVRVPGGLAPPPDDLSAFVPVALMLAMRRREPLQIDGAVSGRLLRELPHAQAMLSAWDPSYERVAVRAARVAAAAEPAAGRTSCFTRGVDSMFSAAVSRSPDPELTHLLYCETLEPRFGKETRRQEVTAVREAATRLDKELVVVSTNVRELLRGVIDFEDAYGAVLAMLGLCLSSQIGHLTIPSGLDYGGLVPVGSHPLLDRLWSTEAVQVEHDSCVLGRAGKVRWLAEHRPDLLPMLHVCFAEDSTRNCGRCGKCLLTMVLLRAAGALGSAGSFPPEIDLDRLARGADPTLLVRLYVNDVYWTLPPDPEHDELRAALAKLLRRCAGASDAGSVYGISRRHTRLIRALEAGRPFPAGGSDQPPPAAEFGELDPSWPPPRDVPPGRIGITVGLDKAARRHVYGLGDLPQGILIGELGAALAEPLDGARPLSLDNGPANARRPSLAAALRWTFAPLGWGGTSRLARLRSTGRRALNSAASLTSRSNGRAPERPRAWLHRDPAPGRLPLYAAPHPVVGDVLLSTDQETPRALRYGEPTLLGYLEARAPVTGSLGVERNGLAWAHRWGRDAGAYASADARAS